MANGNFKAGKAGGIAYIVAAVIFFAIAVFVGVMVFRDGGGEGFVIFAVLMAILAVMFACFGVSQLLNADKANVQVANPNSIAHATYGGGKTYTRFSAYINRGSQTARNAAVNVAGVASAFLFGVGFFTWRGVPVYDVFVNDDEVIINCYKKNPSLNPGSFICIPAAQIAGVDFRPAKSGVYVVLQPYNGNHITLEILVSAAQPIDRIRSEFSRLLSTPADPSVGAYDTATAPETADTSAAFEDTTADTVASPEETTTSAESGEDAE